LFGKKRKTRNNNNNRSVSVAAASDKICLTSDGYGLSMDKLRVCGMFTTKLGKLGSSLFIGTEEFPCSATNSFCLVTTTSGKSKLGLICLAVKKKITKKM
jgi:hypothetical protein